MSGFLHALFLPTVVEGMLKMSRQSNGCQPLIVAADKSK